MRNVASEGPRTRRPRRMGDHTAAARRLAGGVPRMVRRPWVHRIRRAPLRPAPGELLGVVGRGVAGSALRAAAAEPGQVCDLPAGAVFDVAVDIRVGSPTFGKWDSVLLDDRTRRSIYISEGLAHGLLALQDDSTVIYLCSAGYNPAREHTIRATDPALGIEWPGTDLCCRIATPRLPRSTRSGRRVCCRRGTKPGRSSTTCAAAAPDAETAERSQFPVN